MHELLLLIWYKILDFSLIMAPVAEIFWNLNSRQIMATSAAGQIYVLRVISTQPPHHVYMTSYWRRIVILALHRRQ